MRALQRAGIDISDASMCWIKEPNEGYYRLTVHDEYCYEMSCLRPVPAYTLEDLFLKIKGTLEYNPLIVKGRQNHSTPWTFSILKNDYSCIEEGIITFGESPLEASYRALLKLYRVAPQCIEILMLESIS